LTSRLGLPIIRGVPASPDPDVSSLISVRQAIDLIDAEPVVPRVVRVPLAAARGLRLAADVTADRDYPPFDKSLMDGYAVRAADVAKVPADLPVVGEVPAGQPAPRGIKSGEAMAVMTGAPVPPGTECVVPVEQTEELDDAAAHGSAGFVGGRVRVLKAAAAGYAIARRGSDVPAGHLLLAAGTVLESAAMAVAASVGAAEVDVYARPRVAVLGTGDEVVAFDGPPPAEWQIRNSNNVMLVALLERLGCEVTDLGVVRDDPALIADAIARGAAAADALFVTGGMSMGEYDFVPRVLVEQGYALKVSKVRVKPGKPFVFAVRRSAEGKVLSAEAEETNAGSTPPPSLSTQHSALSTSSYVFGLPGNPVSAYVCTLRLASRLLARLAGGRPGDRWQTGRLEAGLPANGPREFYQPVVRRAAAGLTSSQNEMPAVEVLNWKGSADVFTLARANGLLVRAENEPALPKGTMVRVLEI
jgi:molybdopterin molybdotransferase